MHVEDALAWMREEVQRAGQHAPQRLVASISALDFAIIAEKEAKAAGTPRQREASSSTTPQHGLNTDLFQAIAVYMGFQMESNPHLK
eukprot:12907557-Prorocentrum_lima.AAC.1